MGQKKGGKKKKDRAVDNVCSHRRGTNINCNHHHPCPQSSDTCPQSSDNWSYCKNHESSNNNSARAKPHSQSPNCSAAPPSSTPSPSCCPCCSSHSSSIRSNPSDSSPIHLNPSDSSPIHLTPPQSTVPHPVHEPPTFLRLPRRAVYPG